MHKGLMKEDDFLGKQVRGADQAKVRQRKSVVFRMNFLFFMIFVLFSLLILRLGYLQIVKSEDYIRKLERTEEIAVNTSVPRGRIFDREGRILVNNDPKNAITYTKMSSSTAKEMLAIAEDLAVLIEQDTKRTTIGDTRDFWILKNEEAAAKKVSKKEHEKLAEDDLSRKEIQQKVNRLTRERITDEELNSFTENELQVLAIYREMMSGYAYSPQIVKSGDVTEEEFAAVSERLRELPGINTTTDWERVRKTSNTILGTTTNPTEGIPKSSLDYYLARDYSRNDRVGRSFIEQHYEELLQGQKSIVKNIKDRTGEVVEMETVREGEPGKDLVLTIDSELQDALEDILEQKLFQLKSGSYSRALDRAFIVMLDPNNGEVLSLVGKQIVRSADTGKYEIRDYAFGTFTDVYAAGSTVKMATLLTGYQEGAARVGETKMDEMLQIAGTPSKSSVFNRTYNRIPINDIEAIGRSSNVYMFKTAIGIGGSSYRRGGALNTNDDAFDIMRNSFSSFGLGVKTGIDLPGEAVGHSTKPEQKGLLLDLAIGQFDTYTTLQLAQYVSTIANGGYRIAPKVVKEIHEPSLDGENFGPLIQETETTILNKVNNTDAEISRVKQGMYYTYYGPRGTARNIFQGKAYNAAGKTGTSQSGASIDGKYTSTISLSHVGFAPFEKPEMAYAVLIPHISTSSNSYNTLAMNTLVVEAVDKYFELKAKKDQNKEPSDAVQKIKPPFEVE